MTPEETTLTRLLRGEAYGAEAIEEILPIVYKELRRNAAVFLRKEKAGHTLAATELVHEVYLRLFRDAQPQFNDRRHFFATAAIAMRRILVEHARRKQAGKRIPELALVSLDGAREQASGPAVDILSLDEALSALAKIDSRMAQVVELRYFAGLTESEVAEVLEVSRPTVSRTWKAARLWLRREMRS
jgi:RNA polymerase sigma factor (TIGR02999 family)